MSQPPGTQSVAEMRAQTGSVGGKGLAHHLEDLERKAHPVLQAAAVFVVALVGDRREELVQQVAVRGVDLDAVEAEPGRAPRGGGEIGAHLGQAVGIERERRVLARRVRHGRGRDGTPRPGLAEPDLRPAQPGRAARGLAAGVGELHAHAHRRVRAHAREHAVPAPLRWRRSRGPDRPDVMRPSAETAVASTISRPAPDSARWPRWIRCQSPAEPSFAEYWHIGAMTMRLGR